MVDGEVHDPGLFPPGVGERLRVLREQAGLDLNDIGTRTRIPVRHLAAIERGDFAALPSATYSLGFTKAYARALGADENALVHDLRDELGREQPETRTTQVYEPADPSRVPPRVLAWTAAILALLMAVGYGVWRSEWFDGPVLPAPAVSPAPAPRATAPAVPTAATPSNGEVVLTASAPVWVRITDAGGAKLIERELAAGEHYAVPRDARDPKILTGRAESLTVTVDGRPVAPLGPPATTVTTGISAAALAARPPAPPASAQ
ncbi:MAG: DUF4115 domain-containing protein [Sphingomonadaceae bacterium]|nr:DUF4115 domain-containing protein [Sphingomonadaceae bacterium]